MSLDRADSLRAPGQSSNAARGAQQVGPVRVGSVDVVIEVPNATLHEWLLDLCSGLQRRDGASPPTETRLLRVTTVSEGRQDPIRWIELWNGTTLVVRSARPDQVLASLLDMFDQWSYESEPNELHLHGGCVVDSDRVATLVLGRSKAGKSTLVSHLCQSGWNYVTDEVVRVEADGSVDGLTRPISIRGEGAEHAAGSVQILDPTRLGTRMDLVRRWSQPHFTNPVRALRPLVSRRGQRTVSEPLPSASRYISPGSLPLAAGPAPWNVGTVVVCDRQDQGQAALTELSTARAVPELLKECFDADRLGRSAFERLVRLVDGARVVVARYVHAADVVELLHGPAATGSPQDPPTARALPPPDVERPRRSPNVDSWIIGDEVLICEDTAGLAVVLGGSGPALWEALDGTHPLAALVDGLAIDAGVSPETVDHDVRSILPFLESHGLVEP